MSSFSRYVDRAVSRFPAWLAMRLCDTTPFQSATFASYPNVRTRAVGIAGGRRVLGQGSVASLAVHVASRSPVRPWMKMMLKGNVRGFRFGPKKVRTRFLHYLGRIIV